MNTATQKREVRNAEFGSDGHSPARPSRSEVSGLKSEVAVGRPDEFLTKQELAARLKVTVRTVENWQQEGLLPHLKISNTIRFYWPEVVAHLSGKFAAQPSGAMRARWGARKEAGNGLMPRSEDKGQKTEVNQTVKNRHLTLTLSPVEAERESKRRGGAR